MIDLRERISRDTDLLERLEKVIPGLGGYKKKEQIREADKLLRLEIVKVLDKGMEALDELFLAAAENNMDAHINSIKRLKDQHETVSSKIRHADYGYGWLFAEIRVGEPELNVLYEHDQRLFLKAEAIRDAAIGLNEMTQSGQTEGLGDGIAHLRGLYKDLNDDFDRRKTEMVERTN